MGWLLHVCLSPDQLSAHFFLGNETRFEDIPVCSLWPYGLNRAVLSETVIKPGSSSSGVSLSLGHLIMVN